MIIRYYLTYYQGCVSPSLRNDGYINNLLSLYDLSHKTPEKNDQPIIRMSNMVTVHWLVCIVDLNVWTTGSSISVQHFAKASDFQIRHLPPHLHPLN
jgi:hypothetical protein